MRGGLFVLGAVRVERGAAVTGLGGTQPRAVLVSLVLADGRPVPAEELAAVLWPDGPTGHWEGALRGVVAKVRALLALLAPDGPVIDNAGRSYRFVAPPGADVDLRWAGAAVDEAERALAAGRPARAVELADEAAALLGPGLLPGVEADWLRPVRAQLASRRVRSLRLASAAHLELGHHDEAVARAEAAVAADAFDERSHRILIQAHVASGRRAAALRAYGTCRRLLADELGVVPSAETEALHLRVLAADSGTAPEAGVGLEQRGGTPATAPATSADRFVGRADLLAQLAAAWEVARRGQRQVVLLHGEAGVGKTRLALEAARRAAPTHLAYGRCSPEQVVPFEPFADTLTALLGSTADESLSPLLGRVGPEIAALVPAVAARAGVLPRRPSPGADDRARAFEAVTAVFAAVVEEPTVLVVDDLHWCDPSSLELLRHVLGRLGEGRLLVVVTYRDDGPEGGRFSEVIGDLCRFDGCRSLPVGPLAEVEIAELIGGRDRTGPRDLVAVLRERSGGNAFYLHQLLAAMADDPDGWEPTAVPETVSELVRHRVAGLPDDAREAIAVAAVLGSCIDGAVLEQAVRDVDGNPASVEVLVDRGMLVEVGDVQLAFAHEIVREAVYSNLTRTRRRRLHLVAAGSLAAAGTSLEQATAVARHHLAADDPARAPQTLDALLTAAQGASEVRAYEQATQVLEQAESVVARFELGDEALAITSLRLGAARRRAGVQVEGSDGAAAPLWRATDLARSLERHDLFAAAVYELVGHGWRGAASALPDGERLALLEEAVGVSPPDDVDLLVGLLVALARTCLLAGRLDRGVRAAGEAMEAATTGGRPELTLRAIEVQRLVEPGPDQAPMRQAATEALVGSIDGLRPSQVAQLHAWRLADALELGDRRGVDRELAELCRAADGIDRPHWRWVASSWRATTAALAGDDDGADRLALEAVQAADGADQLARMLAYGIQHVGFRLHQGRGAEVVEILREAVDASPEVAAMRAALALALAQSGAGDEASVLVAALTADGFAAVPRDIGWSTTLALLADACLVLGDRSTAVVMRPTLEPFRGRFVVVGSPGAGGSCWGPFETLSGGLSALAGDGRRASEDFAMALRAAEAFGSPALCDHVARARECWVGAG